jgi:hypothetical protein
VRTDGEALAAIRHQHVNFRDGGCEKSPIHIANWCFQELPRVSTLRHSRYD